MRRLLLALSRVRLWRRYRPGWQPTSRPRPMLRYRGERDERERERIAADFERWED